MALNVQSTVDQMSSEDIAEQCSRQVHGERSGGRHQDHVVARRGDGSVDTHDRPVAHRELIDVLQRTAPTQHSGGRTAQQDDRALRELLVGRAVFVHVTGEGELEHLRRADQTVGHRVERAVPGDGELKRLYVLKSLQNGGWGGHLFRTTLDWLERDGPRTLWIGVWSQNHGAQRFYERHGFQRVGEYKFAVGKTLDDEFILRRTP